MKIKKFAAIIMAVILVTLLAVPAFAVASDTNIEDEFVLESYKVNSTAIYPTKQNITVNLKFSVPEDTKDVFLSVDGSNFRFHTTGDGNTDTRKPILSDGKGKNNFESTVDGNKIIIKGSITVDATKKITYGITDIMSIKMGYVLDNGYHDTVDFGVPYTVIDKPTEDIEEETPESTLTPHLFITGYNVSDEPIEAGNEFTLTVNFKNTSKTEIIENVIMTYTLPGGMALSNASNKFFFANVPAQGTASQTVTIESDGSLANGLQNIGIGFEYQYMSSDIYQSGSDSDSLSVRVGAEVQEETNDRFEISSVELPDMVYLGQEEYITINLINKGSKPLNNVTAKINSENISNDGYNEYLGQLQANSKGEVELTINPSTTGDIIGVITISYEHEDGTEYELTRDFTVYCEDPNAWMEDPGFYEDPIYEEPVESGTPWFVWALIVVGIIVVIIVAVKVTKTVIKKKKEKALEESLDEDI